MTRKGNVGSKPSTVPTRNTETLAVPCHLWSQDRTCSGRSASMQKHRECYGVAGTAHCSFPGVSFVRNANILLKRTEQEREAWWAAIGGLVTAVL